MGGRPLLHPLSSLFLSLCRHPFPSSLLELLNQEVKSCKDPMKLLASINVYVCVCTLLAPCNLLSSLPQLLWPTAVC